VKVTLLGPLAVAVDGRPVPVQGSRRAAVLTALALRCGEVVTIDQLVDLVWAGSPPTAAVATLQSHVSQLRRIAHDPGLVRVAASGYVLAPGDRHEPATDLQQAQHLISAAAACEARGAVPLLREALTLWRGQPLVSVVPGAWFDAESRRIDALQNRGQRALIEARLTLGEHAEIVDELEAQTLAHPYDELLHQQLMLALYRCGRAADALAVVHRLRLALDRGLGVAPGPAVRALESAILLHDPTLSPGAVDASPLTHRAGPAGEAGVTAAVPSPAAPRWVPPAQLPAAVPRLAGRGRELAGLHDLLPAAAASSSALVAVVSGTAGVGKTALVLHWAHQVPEAFPEGQLYVDLCGFHPASAPMSAAEAVRGFLDALGVPPERVPAGLGAQTALYRSLLGGRRVLVVLDNARDADQVRPLLPGAAGCVAVVTSRTRLTALVATTAAVELPLDLLDVQAAKVLLASRVGADRAAAEPAAMLDLATRCARLPLALAVTGARAATRPGVPLADLAKELHSGERALDALPGGDSGTDLRAVFSWSVDALSADAATAFRLLALHPGPHVTLAGLAGLVGRPPEEARAALLELVHAHLLSEGSPGRYACHDLLRAYAAEELAAHSQQGRHAALDRLFDHYLRSARAAVETAYGPLPLAPEPVDPPASVGLRPEAPADARTAHRWLAAEHPVLLALAQLAAASSGFEPYAWRYAHALTLRLRYQRHWDQALTLHRAAVEASQRSGNRSAEAYARLGLGRALSWTGAEDGALEQIRTAQQMLTELGDVAGLADTWLVLGGLACQRGSHEESLTHTERALAGFRSTGHVTSEALALNNIGWCHVELGHPAAALAPCRQAVDLFHAGGHRPGEASAWDSLGLAHHGLADPDTALTCYAAAIDLYREIDNSYHEAETLTRVGDTHQARGDHQAARAAWRRALDLLTELDHDDRAAVRVRLACLPPAHPRTRTAQRL